MKLALFLILLFAQTNATVTWTSGATSGTVVPSCTSGYSVWRHSTTTDPTLQNSQSLLLAPPEYRQGTALDLKVDLTKTYTTADATFFCRADSN